jgi:hypothetical protein
MISVGFIVWAWTLRIVSPIESASLKAGMSTVTGTVLLIEGNEGAPANGFIDIKIFSFPTHSP